ncbi:aminoacetone oxidase family FAD-binding enzyme [Anaerococcus urinomassiliensis]|uniref:aminoacetone oxidase family FAD-binding enzyme n=1 Tax=Anaerococcus urinomassiliensis TaxID=1745712 RepID=UPI00093CBCCA|nr:aminoacetone oxidase family FAD-binding enzyme [Anaerococcus urinomassiliensis]
MRILVIGAGVSALFFASFMDGGDITVIEKNEFAGRKLLATGNGRCNFTNLNQGKEFFKSNNPGFVDYAINTFDSNKLIGYFNEIGIATTHLPSGRCYPLTMSSKTVRDSLFLKAKENAEFVFNQEVIAIDFDKKQVKTKDKSYTYDKLVISTGGKTLKNSGSDGKIFDLIKDRVKVTPMTYGITNFETKEKFSKKAKGTKITGKASLLVDGKYIKSSVDDIIFQNYGLTGTAILDISNELSISLKNNSKIQIEIDFFPGSTKEEFTFYLRNIAKKFPARTIKEILIGIINEKLIDDILKVARVSPDKKANNLNDKDFEMLSKTLKSLRFNITDIHDRVNAQVTIGGVDTRYIDPKTMADEKYKDVFFIGECLDVAGDCGGYNIWWAAASAFVSSKFLRSLNV